MTAALGGRLRLVLPWVPPSDHDALELALEWSDRLGLSSGAAPAVCVWSTRVPHREDLPTWADRLCWHDLALPARIDRHVQVASPRLPWSPWGTKSGPNYQFFALLDQHAATHEEPWVLLVEPDTFPIGLDVSSPVARVLDDNPDAWMIGGKPHPAIRSGLARELHEHLNGAALYRAGDADFAEFRAAVWIPSLLWIIRDQPTFGYDCVTDPASRTDLPIRLLQQWSDEQDRFVATTGIVNLSTTHLHAARLERELDSPWLVRGLLAEGTVPWMLHMKGARPDQVPALPGLTLMPGPVYRVAPGPVPLARYDAAWSRAFPSLATTALSAPAIVVNLHLPKTGGTSLTTSVAASRSWAVARFHLSSTPWGICACGDADCEAGARRVRSLLTTPDELAHRRLFIKVGHERYSGIDWLRARLAEQDATISRTIMSVRPVRQRLVSMFTDYWTHVFAADDADAGRGNLTPHLNRTAHAYQRDAVHYRRPDGSIDGRGWFGAFGDHGGGVVFYLDEAFDGSPERFACVVESGELALAPTSNLDSLIQELTGDAPRERRRVSRVGRSPAVAEAIEDCTDLLDELAQRDAVYDAIFARHLGDLWSH